MERKKRRRVDGVRTGVGGTRRCLLNRRDQYDVLSCNSNGRVFVSVCRTSHIFAVYNLIFKKLKSCLPIKLTHIIYHSQPNRVHFKV